MASAEVVVQAGQARQVDLRGSGVSYLMTAKDSKACSLFEFDAAPGFDNGVGILHLQKTKQNPGISAFPTAWLGDVQEV